MEVCASCQKEFVKLAGGKRYNRSSLRTLLSPTTCKTIYKIDEHHYANSYICHDCESELKKNTVLKQRGGKKRKLPPPPTNIEEGEKRKRSITSTQSTIDNAIKHLKDYRYDLAIRCLCKDIPAAEKAVVEACCRVLQGEKKKLTKTDSCFNNDVTEANLENFSWKEALEESKGCAPATIGCLTAMLPEAKTLRTQKMMGPRSVRRMQTMEEAQRELDTRKGVLVSIILYTSKPKKHKFIATSLGIEMWRLGCPVKAFRCLNHFGICQGIAAAREHIDRLRTGQDMPILAWKESAEKPEPPRGDEAKMKGFGLCFDNVQIQAHTHHASSLTHNAFYIWAMCFAVKNRLEPLPIPSSSSACKRACHLSPYAFLPSPDDYLRLRKQMLTIVTRILQDNFTFIRRHSNRNKHCYSQQMAEKSTVISLGVIDVNPSTNTVCIQVLNHLQKYVPTCKPILCTGDGLSVERMVHAQRSRANGNDEKEKLSGFIPTPAEFHKEMLLLQDFMNSFFKGSSVTARGTVAHLKEFFEHRSLQQKVSANFQHAWDMMEFATHAYVSMKAQDAMGITCPSETPPTFPKDGSAEEKKDWLQKIALSVVDFCWQAPSAAEVREVADAITPQFERADTEVFPYCFCGEARGSTMVKCCSVNCTNTWFHLECVDLDEAPADEDDWFCSATCEGDGTYIYCFCHERRGGRMVQCRRKGNCLRHEWYHLTCVDKGGKGVKGKWYCSPQCESKSEEQDGVLSFSKGLMWAGLNALFRRDAIREGDGPVMVGHWKMDIINFHNGNHHKYLIIGAHFLAGVAGFQPPHVAFQLIWNRVVNLSGRPAANLPMDLVNEFLNREFKERMSHSRGNYTAAQDDRCSRKCVGTSGNV